MTDASDVKERPDVVAMHEAASILGLLMARAMLSGEPGHLAKEEPLVQTWSPDAPELQGAWDLCAGVTESEDGLLVGVIGSLGWVEKAKGGVVGRFQEFIPVSYSFQSRHGAPPLNAGRIRQVAITQLAERVLSAALQEWEALLPVLEPIEREVVSPELPSAMSEELRTAWSVVVKGRSRDRRDYELLAAAYRWLVSSGHHAPAAHLASILGCSGSVLRNRLSKARSLGLTA